ncbi:hypothetical protein N5853_11935 [Bartonella sp. HY329]|uniref:hypothetical protein n=1 Tax=unclassified Bartonella TaxID=2645622 RepID=UPI0021C60114|nr:MULTISPECIES: hypothetical protein [unclassified Bartonella]UXM94791.1 hypothetical protein N5853_11935 [Bartonella sp. HY329]UXN09114.1 hypothetical protein N5852_11945 [Bartonella sp. HY328]
MKITIELDDVSVNGLRTFNDKEYKGCSIEMAASQLLTKTLKELGYVTDIAQTGTLPENLNSSNDD